MVWLFYSVSLRSLAQDAFDLGMTVFETVADKASLGSLSITSEG
jgi:hypothetical protein